MKRNLLTLAAVALFALAALGTAGHAYAQGPTPGSTQAAGPNDQTPTYACSVKAGGTPTITAPQAQAAALAANPGATATSVGLDDENGCLVYGVQLSNGADVKVDAGNGAVLHTDAAGPDDGTTAESSVEAPEGGETGN